MSVRAWRPGTRPWIAGGVAACFVVLYHLHTTVIANVAIVSPRLAVRRLLLRAQRLRDRRKLWREAQEASAGAYMILRLGSIRCTWMIALRRGRIACSWPASGMQGRAFNEPRSLPFLADNLLLIQIFVPGAKRAGTGQLEHRRGNLDLCADRGRTGPAGAAIRFVLVAITCSRRSARLAWGRLRIAGTGPSSAASTAFPSACWPSIFRALARARRPRSIAATCAEAGLVLLGGAAIIWLIDSRLEFACLAVRARHHRPGAGRGSGRDLLKLAPLRRLGDWSYSIYMVHSLVSTASPMRWPGPVPGWACRW